MSFPTYPAYKDSGVEWLGDVPEHWNISPLKFSASCNDTVLPDSTDDDYEIEYVEISDVNEMSGITGSTSYKFADAPSRARRMLQDGDVLVSTVRTYLRAIAPVVAPPENLIASTGFAVVRPRKGILDGAFLGYLLRAEWWISEVIARSVGVSYPAINASDLIGLNVPVPAWHEQTQIARFLDHETARIDALIEEQQRLIELLKEKRQAVISHAVTKGLDPSVQMKDSGVEWLGEVPAHWDVVCIKHIKSWRPNAFVDGPFGSNLKSEHFVDDGDVYVIESGFATTGELNFGDLKQITLEHFETIKRSEVCAGDIVIAKIGARYGMCSILPWIDKPAVVSGNSLKLTVNERICDPKFAVFVLQHLKERGAIEDIVNMTAQPALSLGEMNNLPFPLPSLGEQLSIVSELEKELGEFEALTSECKQVMSFAIERRSALISAAVTGKIDVRGWQPPASTQAPEPAVAEAD